MAEPIRFVCCYCASPIATAAEQAECMIECPGCGRSVLAPDASVASGWPAPPPPPLNTWLSSAMVTAAASLMGGMALGLLLYSLMYAAALRWMAISFRDAAFAGGVGFVVGMFCFGILGWHIATR